jgi:hypothetical protein
LGTLSLHELELIMRMAIPKDDVEVELQYEPIPPLTKLEVDAALASGDTKEVCQAILSLALHDDDWRTAQNLCLSQLSNRDIWVKRTSLTALGHIVRIHQTLDLKIVVRAVCALPADNLLDGWVDQLLDDIEIFYRTSPQALPEEG